MSKIKSYPQNLLDVHRNYMFEDHVAQNTQQGHRDDRIQEDVFHHGSRNSQPAFVERTRVVGVGTVDADWTRNVRKRTSLSDLHQHETDGI